MECWFQFNYTAPMNSLIPNGSSFVVSVMRCIKKMNTLSVFNWDDWVDSPRTN